MTLILVRKIKEALRQEEMNIWYEAARKHVENEEEGSPIKLIEKVAKALISSSFDMKEEMDI